MQTGGLELATLFLPFRHPQVEHISYPESSREVTGCGRRRSYDVSLGHEQSGDWHVFLDFSRVPTIYLRVGWMVGVGLEGVPSQDVGQELIDLSITLGYFGVMVSGVCLGSVSSCLGSS